VLRAEALILTTGGTEIQIIESQRLDRAAWQPLNTYLGRSQDALDTIISARMTRLESFMRTTVIEIRLALYYVIQTLAFQFVL
jgi:hypothetical protein